MYRKDQKDAVDAFGKPICVTQRTPVESFLNVAAETLPTLVCSADQELRDKSLGYNYRKLKDKLQKTTEYFIHPTTGNYRNGCQL